MSNQKPRTVEEQIERLKKLGMEFTCLLYLCNALDIHNTIKDDIINLFESHPSVPIFMLGFTGDWKNSLLWK